MRKCKAYLWDNYGKEEEKLFFIYSFKKYFISINYMPGISLYAGDTSVNKTEKHSAFMELILVVEKTDNK